MSELWVVVYTHPVTKQLTETEPASHEKAIESFYLLVDNHNGAVLLKPYIKNNESSDNLTSERVDKVE